VAACRILSFKRPGPSPLLGPGPYQSRAGARFPLLCRPASAFTVRGRTAGRQDHPFAGCATLPPEDILCKLANRLRVESIEGTMAYCGGTKEA